MHDHFDILKNKVAQNKLTCSLKNRSTPVLQHCVLFHLNTDDLHQHLELIVQWTDFFCFHVGLTERRMHICLN